MKRTYRARFINVGKDSPTYVDKFAVHGKVFTDKKLIENQLKGINPSYTCPVCDRVLTIQSGYSASHSLYEHNKTKVHIVAALEKGYM